MAKGIPTYEQFRRSLAGTPMAGEARGIYNAALRGGINPAFVSGLASAESSYGTKGYAVGKKNPYGLGVHLGWQFPSYAKATERLTQTLNSLGYPSLYKKRGLAGVISQYTPASDGNDEGGHFRNIVSAGRRTGGNPALVYARGPLVSGGAMQDEAAPLSAPAMGLPAPRGAATGFDIANPLMAQYRASLRGELTPEQARANTMKLARAAGASRRMSAMQPAPSATTPTMPADTGTATTALNYGSVRGIARPLPTPLGGSDYGYSDPEGQDGRHLAKDWFAKGGTPLASPVTGKVFRIKPDTSVGKKASGQVFGGSVYIRDTENRVWVFRHVENPQAYTQAGRNIRAGQRIGAVKPWSGSSHAHIELYGPGPYEYSSKRALNPHDFFRKAGFK